MYLHPKNYSIKFIWLHLSSVIQEILLHLFVYIYEKKYRRSNSRRSNPSLPLVLSHLRTLRTRLPGNMYWMKSYPFEDHIGEEKTKRLRKVRQGKSTPHDSKAAKPTPPSSSHLQEKWDGLPGSPPRARRRRSIKSKPVRHTKRW